MGVWPSDVLLKKQDAKRTGWEPPDTGWESAQSISWAVGI